MQGRFATIDDAKEWIANNAIGRIYRGSKIQTLRDVDGPLFPAVQPLIEQYGVSNVGLYPVMVGRDAAYLAEVNLPGQGSAVYLVTPQGVQATGQREWTHFEWRRSGEVPWQVQEMIDSFGRKPSAELFEAVPANVPPQLAYALSQGAYPPDAKVYMPQTGAPYRAVHWFENGRANVHIFALDGDSPLAVGSRVLSRTVFPPTEAASAA